MQVQNRNDKDQVPSFWGTFHENFQKHHLITKYHFAHGNDELFFPVWLTDEGHLALFPAGTIARDSYRRKSSTRREQD